MIKRIEENEKTLNLIKNDTTQQDKVYDTLVAEKMLEKYPQSKQNAILMKALNGDMTEYKEMLEYQVLIKKEIEKKINE